MMAIRSLGGHRPGEVRWVLGWPALLVKMDIRVKRGGKRVGHAKDLEENLELGDPNLPLVLE